MWKFTFPDDQVCVASDTKDQSGVRGDVQGVYVTAYRGCTRRRTGGVRDGVHKPPNEPKKEPPKYINPRSKTPVAPQNRKPSSLALAENLGHVAENVGTDNVGTEELGHIKKTNSSKKIKELRRLKHPLNPRPENLNS